MKNLIVIVLSIMILSSVSWAIRGELPRDGKGQKLQTCAPTLKNDAIVTGNNQTFNVTDANCWMVYVGNDTKFRVMTSATKVGVAHTITGGSWFVETPSDYKYVNISSAGSTGTFRSDKF